jgi:uncharacterized protein (TIRG00374 family)
MLNRFKRFDKKTIRQGLNIFFGLSVASIALVFVFTEPGRTLEALARIQPAFLAAALTLAVADWLGGGLRIYVLTRGLSRRISFRASVKAALANVSMGAMTPSQAGGGPAQVFLLYKNGLPFVEAVSATLMTFVVTVIFFVISAGAITFFGVSGSIDDSRVYTLFRYGVSLFMVFGMMFIVFISKPDWLRSVIRWLFQFLSLFRRDHLLSPGSTAQRILEAVDEFHETNLHYFSRRLPAMILSVLVTALLFGTKCMVAYFIVRGLGVSAGVWEVVSVQVLILLAVYFFPTPGGTGAAELGAAVLMASILPLELLTVFVVLWRLIVMYLAVVLGAAVMVRALGQDTLIATRPGYGSVEKKIAVSGE